ncbi:TIMM23B isoform 3 [Pongo abelii]|uniref:TIMM23B isoform 3 n=1 Tax=Pongo abelii TaxID=9601 RepID=A0A2J8R2P9_PONAB|nr:TIMM23B isoform 3 [Pongo abelii]
MEGGGGSGNKTTGGLAGFFGAGGAGYSHADLAGVPRYR